MEQMGITHIPASLRRGRPRDLAWLWAGTNLTMQTVLFGSFLPYLGLSFWQCVALIAIGNLTWGVVGYASLQGPAAGTSIFAISRASFGLRGGRIVALLSWVTQVLYETLGLSVIALAGLALLDRAGVHSNAGLKVALVIVGSAIQMVLPLFGHAWIMRVLRLLTFPFLVLFIVLTALTWSKVSTSGHSGGLAAILSGLAVVLAGGSFAWVVNASDYSRYLPSDSSRRQITLAVSVGGYITTTPLMILGAAITSIPSFGGDIISGLPKTFPAWFVVPYLLFVIVQNYGVNSVDLYSSSLSLQAAGLPLRQWQATTIDCVVSASLTLTVLFSPSFNSAISDIVLFVMVWVSPWSAVFLLDWAMRRRHPNRYEPAALFASRSGPYWVTGGYRVPGLVALVLGAVASACCINTAIFTGPVARAMDGADLSIPAGIVVAGIVYWIGARQQIHREISQLNSSEMALSAPRTAAEALA
jgi:purine-cytosine permease-like protein